VSWLLEITRADRSRRVVAVDTLPVRIGRDASADVPILDDKLSAIHAVIEMGPAGPQLRDLQSFNGIYVGHQLSPRAVVPLESARTARVGDTFLRLHSGYAPEKPTADLPAVALGIDLFLLVYSFAAAAFLVHDYEIQNWWKNDSEPAEMWLDVLWPYMLWAGVLSVMDSIYRGKRQLIRYAAGALSAGLTVYAVERMTEVSQFLRHAPWDQELPLVVSPGIFLLVGALQMRTIGVRWTVPAVIALLAMFGVADVSEEPSDDDRFEHIQRAGAYVDLPTRRLDPVPLDKFLQDIEDMAQKVEPDPEVVDTGL